jgi:hypothetical protein
MKRLVMVFIMVALAGCRGEPTPRDYQNAPPAMTHPPQKKSETPAQNGMGQAPPLSSSGATGTAAPTQPVTPSDTATTTISDTPPTTTS